MVHRLLLIFTFLILLSHTNAEESKSTSPQAAKRGRELLLGKSFNPAVMSTRGYHELWKVWGEKKRPDDFEQQVYHRYGLHPAPFPNKGFPMGLREDRFLFGKGLTTDCLVCHGGSIFGKSYIGLGNSTLDYQALLMDLSKSEGRSYKPPFEFCRTRGTIEAGAMSVFLFERRNPDLSMRTSKIDLDLRDDLCEDTPAWWLLKKKKTMYHTGGANARSVRSIMQFMLTPFNTAETIKSAEKSFKDIQAFLLSIEPPKYPMPINDSLAAKGEKLFERNCAKCHGTYGEEWTYPNRIVPLKEIGTDPTRLKGLSKRFADYYNTTWFAQEKGPVGEDYQGKVTKGYQAPPLDGIWATAPYFHNGSAPTVYHVLNSKARPKIFTRSFRTGKKDYDAKKLGWKITELSRGADPKLPAIERRKIYDTTKPGRSNTGHTYGDKLTDAQRMAIIEYLKTL